MKDKYYERIKGKFDSGEFTSGNDCSFNLWFDIDDLRYVPREYRTPEMCVHALDYTKGKFSDVPEESRTREFFINAFYDEDVREYIRSHISRFDRQFFKDLITTKKNAALMHSKTNCFAIMPKEYIDEEMCSIAIMNATDWVDDDWVETVRKRKPSAMTNDLWHLATRLYILNGEDAKRWFASVPEEYRDEDLYLEAGRCNFNCGMAIRARREHILESAPQEVMTDEFIKRLIMDNPNNSISLSNEHLERVIDGRKLWQTLLLMDGEQIENMDLNDERNAFFLSHYDKDSMAYRYSFKDRYKRYLKEKQDKEQAEKVRARQNEDDTFSALGTLLFASTGMGSDNAIDLMRELTRDANEDRLPIRYRGPVPAELRKQYDQEEYLALLYSQLGIKILEESDYYYYLVELPEGWTTTCDGSYYSVKNADGEEVIRYYDNNKFYDRDVDILNIEFPKEKGKEKEKNDDK